MYICDVCVGLYTTVIDDEKVNGVGSSPRRHLGAHRRRARHDPAVRLGTLLRRAAATRARRRTGRLLVRAVEALTRPPKVTLRLPEVASHCSDTTPAELPPSPRYRTQRQLKPEEVEQVVAAFKAGTSMQKLADRFGVDRTTILRRLQALGLRTRFSKSAT